MTGTVSTATTAKANGRSSISALHDNETSNFSDFKRCSYLSRKQALVSSVRRSRTYKSIETLPRSFEATRVTSTVAHAGGYSRVNAFAPRSSQLNFRGATPRCSNVVVAFFPAHGARKSESRRRVPWQLNFNDQLTSATWEAFRIEQLFASRAVNCLCEPFAVGPQH